MTDKDAKSLNDTLESICKMLDAEFSGPEQNKRHEKYANFGFNKKEVV